MAFKSFGSLEIGSAFRRDEITWIKVFEITVDGTLFNAYSFNESKMTSRGESACKVSLMRDECLVQTQTDVSQTRQEELRILLTPTDELEENIF